MRTLLAETYAPITSEIGYVNRPFDRVVSEYARWHEGLNYPTTVADVSGDGFPDAFHRLEPLTSGPSPRVLLVAHGQWTAYFDCGIRGTDPIVPVGQLARRLSCRGLAIATVPHTVVKSGVRPGRLGARKWELFASRPTEFMNYQRTIALVHDGVRWVFETAGLPLPFEDVARYRERRLADRFNSEMIERYSQAVGVDPFNPNAYGPEIALSRTTWDLQVVPTTMSLWDAQRWLGVEPGRADPLPG